MTTKDMDLECYWYNLEASDKSAYESMFPTKTPVQILEEMIEELTFIWVWLIEINARNTLTEAKERIEKECSTEVSQPNGWWIPVSEKYPEHGKEVIAFYINEYWMWRRLKAQYLYKWKEESDYDSSGEPYDEYIEEEDKYTYIEWWYECNEIDDWQYYISEKITHWMPLPTPPNQ